MNLDNVKTKGIIDENKFVDLANSIAQSILDMKFISKENISVLIKAQMKIFYEKQHDAKLRLKLRQTEDNMAEMRIKTKEHNCKMAFATNFWKYKYKNLVTSDNFNEAIEEIKALEEK